MDDSKIKMADGCFFILCGIPASGKSTIAKDLILKDWKIDCKCVHFIYINYDDFIPDNLLVNEEKHCAKWKDMRREIVSTLENLLLSKENIVLGSDNQVFSKFISSWCSCGGGVLHRCNDILHVVVIDDNMFYRSMRYEYYQLARKTSFSFVQVHLHCPVSLALLRNTQRKTSVTQETIIKMFHCIEKPNPEKFSWEKFSISVDTSSSQNDDKWETILKLLENAIVFPAPPLKTCDDIQKVKDRAITMKSIIHQVDQIMRKHISVKLEELKAKNNPRDILKQEALFLNQRRKEIIEEMKKEPKKIIYHVLNDKSSWIESYSQDNNLTMNKTKIFDITYDYDLLTVDSIHKTVLESFWDLITPEELEYSIKRLLEQR